MDAGTAKVVFTIIAILVVSGVICFFGWLAGTGAKIDTGTDDRVIGYSGYFRGLGFLGAVFMPGFVMTTLIVLIASGQNISTDDIVGASVVAIVPALVGGLFLVEGYRTKIRINDAGLTRYSWARGPLLFAWSDIAEVKSAKGVITVLNKAGKKIKLNEFMGPKQWLAEACKAHLPVEVYAGAFDVEK